MPSLTVEVRGLKEIVRALQPRALLSRPLTNFLQRWSISVQSEARKRAPVDTGHLRNMIGQEVDKSPLPLWAKAGIDANAGSPLWFKARAMEYGTGLRGDPEVSHEAGHFPPGAALDTWAKRHGAPNGWVIAAAIARRGGLDPRRYLRNAAQFVEQSRLGTFLEQLRSEIAQNWSRQ